MAADRRSYSTPLSLTEPLHQANPQGRRESDSSSLRKRFSTLLKPKPPAAAATPPSAEESARTRLSDLPSDKPALEGLINTHLSRLDMYKTRLTTLNAAIHTTLRDRAIISRAPTSPSRDRELALVDSEVEAVRAARDAMSPGVAFHRRELRRIGEKRLTMDREMGVEPRLPQIFDTMWSDARWNDLFAV